MILDQLKDAINSCPLSLRQLEKVTGVSAATLSRFLRAERGLSYDNLVRLDLYFNASRDRFNAPGAETQSINANIKQCEGCKFWSRGVLISRDIGWRGPCKRHAPIGGHGFPQTLEKDWCGDFASLDAQNTETKDR